MFGLDTDPVIRDVARMRYLWDYEMALKDERLEALLGPGFNTPFREAIAATAARYFPAMKAAA